jgi:5S rRNA maturation endonuclease (ribonuclease M5)
MSHNLKQVKSEAKNKWKSIISSLTSISESQLNKNGCPCPVCGGDDRFNFDDKNGEGTWFCRHGADNHYNKKTAGDGFGLLMDLTQKPFKEVLEILANHLGIKPSVYQALPENKSLHDTPIAGVWDNYFVESKNIIQPKRPCLVVPWFDNYSVIRSEWVDKKTGERRKVTNQVYYNEAKKLLTITSIKKDRPLLGADSIDRTKPCLIVEGEKCFVAAKEKLANKYNVLTWVGGAQQSHLSDFQSLKDLEVIIWPDADIYGVKATQRIYAYLEDQNITTKIRCVLPPADAEKGWDLADAVKEGYTSEKLDLFIQSNFCSLLELREQYCLTVDSKPYIPLGLDNKKIYLYVRQTKKIVEMNVNEVNSKTLILIADYEHWLARFYKSSRDGEPSPDFTRAAASIIKDCREQGFFDRSKIRGVGSWTEQELNIFNLAGLTHLTLSKF